MALKLRLSEKSIIKIGDVRVEVENIRPNSRQVELLIAAPRDIPITFVNPHNKLPSPRTHAGQQEAA